MTDRSKPRHVEQIGQRVEAILARNAHDFAGQRGDVGSRPLEVQRVWRGIVLGAQLNFGAIGRRIAHSILRRDDEYGTRWQAFSDCD